MLSDAAGWNQTPDDWSRIISLAPDCCFCVEAGGRVVATSSLLVYGGGLAWLGMVLTHPEHRRRGHARRLIDLALARAREIGIRCVKLDGTAEGQPLYRSLGFQAEQPIERWRRDPGPADAGAGDLVEGDLPFDLDLAAFGADRSRFLRAVAAANGVATVRGQTAYALHRPGSRAWFFGPCVSRTPEGCERLGASLVAQHPDSPWFWDLLPENEAARDIAARLGFRPVRTLSRMWLGQNVRGDDALVYAAGGFEAG